MAAPHTSNWHHCVMTVIVRDYAAGDYGDLTMDLAARRDEWLPGASLHDLRFGC